MFTTAAAATAGTVAASTAAAAGTAAASTAAAAAASAASAVTAGAAAIGGSTLFTMSNAMMAASALSTLGGVYGSIQSSKAQKEQAKYQSAVAQQNADLAEENASAQRRQGYEGMVEQRRKTAKLIGAQRAAAGASGTTVDVGSNLDVQSDTVAQGEMDALKIYQQGLDKAYNYDIQSANYKNQATSYDYSAQQAGKNGIMNATSAAIGGIADMGSTWMKYGTMNGTRNTIHTGAGTVARKSLTTGAKRLTGAR